MSTRKITMADGSETVLERFGEPSERSKAAIVFFPALGTPIRYYRKFGETLASRGYCIAMPETRGQLQSSVRDVKQHNFGYKEVVTLDMVAAIANMRQETESLPLFLVGHSLGGQLALLYRCRFEIDLGGIILVASGSNYYRSLPSAMTRQSRHINIRLVRLINNALGYFPGDKLGFGGRQPLNIINDWTFEGLNGRYRIAGDEFDYNAALARLDLPILMLSLDSDPLIPRSSADFLASKLEAAKIDQETLPAVQVRKAASNHFAWAKQSEPIVDALDHWMDRILPTASRVTA